MDLGLSGSLATEWEHFCDNLNEVGVSLHEAEDSLDLDGRGFIREDDCKKYLYSSHFNSRAATGERMENQTLEMERAAEDETFYLDGDQNKVLTWQVLQGKGLAGSRSLSTL
jgi:hypothetical protein